jgi:cytochrome P450
VLADLLVHKAYDFTKPQRVTGIIQMILGDGLVMVEGDQHKLLRKHSIPAFSFRHIKELYPMMWEKSVLMCEKLEKALEPSKGGDVRATDISGWMSRVTLDIIGVAGVGREFDTLKEVEDPLLEIYLQILQPTPENLTFATGAILFGMRFMSFVPWKLTSMFKDLTDNLRDICMSIVQERKDAVLNSKDDHFDLLSLLIKSGNFSDTQLRDQMLTFLAAGYVSPW